MDDRHVDQDDRRRRKAIRVAKEALDQAPVHRSHRHGLVVGTIYEPDAGDDGPTLGVVVVVQGVDEPCWVMLDQDDLAAIQAFAARSAVPVRLN